MPSLQNVSQKVFSLPVKEARAPFLPSMSTRQPRVLFLHDTLSREKREVFAEDGETLRFYCCGPTVYGPAHIGNFRTFIAQDLFRRVAECSGLRTRHVRNLTDVDDKTIRDSRAA